MIILHATIQIKPGRREEAIPVFLQMQAATRQEEGCLEYTFVSTLENPDTFMAVERWENLACLQSHFDSAHMTLFKEQRADLVTGDSTLYKYEGTALY